MTQRNSKYAPVSIGPPVCFHHRSVNFVITVSSPDRGMASRPIEADLCDQQMTDQATELQLDELPVRRWAVIRAMRPAIGQSDRELLLRLTELGFLPGERVRIMAEGPGGREPIAVRVGHTTFALRRREASFILVRPHA